MYILFFLYSIILGIFSYLFFRTQLLLLFLFVGTAELCFYLIYKKMYIEYNTFERLGYNFCFFIGYFSSLVLYNNMDRDPNKPSFFN